MEWVEFLVRLRSHVDGFYPERLTREHVEGEVGRRLSVPGLEEEGLMEIIVSEKGVDGSLNIPVGRGELWVEELGVGGSPSTWMARIIQGSRAPRFMWFMKTLQRRLSRPRASNS